MRRMILAGMSVGLLALTACGSDDDVDEMDDIDVSIPGDVDVSVPMVTDALGDPTVPPTIDPTMTSVPVDTAAPEMDTPAPGDTTMDSVAP